MGNLPIIGVPCPWGSLKILTEKTKIHIEKLLHGRLTMLTGNNFHRRINLLDASPEYLNRESTYPPGN